MLQDVGPHSHCIKLLRWYAYGALNPTYLRLSLHIAQDKAAASSMWHHSYKALLLPCCVWDRRYACHGLHSARIVCTLCLVHLLEYISYRQPHLAVCSCKTSVHASSCTGADVQQQLGTRACMSLHDCNCRLTSMCLCRHHTGGACTRCKPSCRRLGCHNKALM